MDFRNLSAHFIFEFNITDVSHIPVLTGEKSFFHFTPTSISLIHPINIKHIIIKNNYSLQIQFNEHRNWQI